MIGALLVGTFIALVLILIAIIMTCITFAIVMIIIKIYDLITIKRYRRKIANIEDKERYNDTKRDRVKPKNK